MEVSESLKVLESPCPHHPVENVIMEILSLFVKIQAACLEARMGHLGEGTRQAAWRRNNLMVQEESSRREAET